jgi:xanthine dehydrogenase FAD-binding subunit
LQSLSGRRELPVEDYIQGPGRTDLKADELLVAINIPVEPYNFIYYKKIGTRKADALSKVSFVGLARTVNGIVADIRITLGAVAPRVIRSREAENLLKGRHVNELSDLLIDVKNIYANELHPIDDQRSNATYRRTVSLRLIEYFICQIIK